MTELVREIESLRGQLVPAWGSVRSQRTFEGIARLRQRRRWQSASRWAGSGAVLCALALRWLAQGSGAAVQLSASLPPSASATAPRELHGTGAGARLADGSELRITSADGALSVERDDSQQTALRLRSGAAHFEVQPQAERRFRVTAGAHEIVVVGTAFDVELEGERVRVEVGHGSVRVRGPEGERLVSAGEAQWFEPPSAADEPAAERSSKPRSQRARAKLASDWRSASFSGDYGRAHRLLLQGAAIEDSAEALLDAADAARFSGYPEEAVRYLRRALARHGDSPVCALAAFMLGRVLLERLGRPAEAAEAFAQARERARAASLAEDALAREVEAWSKAGHANLAYDRAQQFQQRYPRSRRLRVVALHAGLPAPVTQPD